MDTATATIIAAIISFIGLVCANIMAHDRKSRDTLKIFIKKILPIIFDIIDGPLVDIPSKTNNFVGRTNDLDSICEHFKAKKRVCITGMGGIGKSAIALEYAHKHVKDYKVIWWINVKTQLDKASDYEVPISVKERFKEFAIEKTQISKDETNERIILREVQMWLENNKRWLFIYDNVEHTRLWLNQYIPRSDTGDVIIMTQDSTLNVYNCEKIELKKFEASVALAFLEKTTTKLTNDQMKELAETLDYFPLSLKQAAAYLRATSITYDEYIKDVAKKLEHAEDVDDYPKSVYATLQISIDKLCENGARQMLNMCAYFAPDSIPLSLFVDSKVFSNFFNVNTDIYEIVKELTRYSLIDCAKNSCTFLHISRTLQKTVQREHSSFKNTQWVAHCLNMACNVEYDYCENTPSMTKFVQNAPHVIEIAQHAEQILNKDEETKKKIARLYSDAGRGFDYTGQYAYALELHHKALDIREKVLGKENPDTAGTYNNIANVYYNMKDSDPEALCKALEWNKKALTIYKKLNNHKYLACTSKNIAVIHENGKNKNEALKWYKKALHAYEKAFGADHEFTKDVQHRIVCLSKSD